MKTPVIQEERSGCGIASVAAAAGLSYAEVKGAANAMGIFAGDPLLWSDTRYVYRLLERFSITAGKKTSFSSWDRLPEEALLAIRWRKVNGKPFWHWVLFLRSDSGACAVLDPKKGLKSNTRRDFWRMRPKWFIPLPGE